MRSPSSIERYRLDSTAAQIRIGRFLATLAEPRTRNELAELLHCSTKTAQIYLGFLMEDQRIHVHDWRRDHPGTPSAVYLAGPGVNKARPRAQTPRQKGRRYRERHPDRCVEVVMRKRIKRLEPQRSDDVAMPFGAA